jgi:hypothetical protein
VDDEWISWQAIFQLGTSRHCERTDRGKGHLAEDEQVIKGVNTRFTDTLDWLREGPQRISVEHPFSGSESDAPERVATESVCLIIVQPRYLTAYLVTTLAIAQLRDLLINSSGIFDLNQTEI